MSYQKDPIEAYIQEEGKEEAEAEEEGAGHEEDEAASLSPLEAARPAGGSGAVLIKGGGDRPRFKADCRTLQDILRGAGLSRPMTIDYISVDAEAAEVEIFKGFPFEDFDISVISVEVQAFNYYEMDAIFLSAGYAKVAVLGGDHVYSKLQRPLHLPDGYEEWQKALAEDFYQHKGPQTAHVVGIRV